MRSLKELRELARELQEKRIVPPFFLQVNKEEVPDLHRLTAFVGSDEYAPSVRKKPSGFFDVGACEYFRFVIRDRRQGPEDRRRG